MDRRWQFSLRMLLGIFPLIGIELWLIQQGAIAIFFAPLFVAAGLQLYGFRTAANRAALVTIIF